MTNGSLAESYLIKVTKQLKILPILLDDEAYSNVVREAQEIVEIALKGMLRQVGMEPPHWHDVGRFVREQRHRFATVSDDEIERLAAVSTALRKERELAFYGAIDFIPTDQYTREQARQAMDDAAWVVSVAARVVSRR